MFFCATSLAEESAVHALDVETVIFDDELSAGQLRNLEKAFGGDVRVCDRTALILLDIFNQRAATHEASLQLSILFCCLILMFHGTLLHIGSEVAAFRATLEEISESSLLVHVVDISHPLAQLQIDAVNNVLAELDVESIPKMTGLPCGRVRTFFNAMYPWHNLLSATMHLYPLPERFILHMLDSTHMFVQPHVAEMIRSRISEFRDQNTYEKPA
ncbi:hypothetical protein H6P81_006713 [Aristolochia fimbriata]|uniref:GTPase HflX N-terminal domain-containing protein n=1 Tax=Aristolochia fimbriata TaxID=158543 RepID=A0AAV7EYZ6_ARIFI|nr:hypothetical protein H6P81_006713 [Aristolochia fimbriata]